MELQNESAFELRERLARKWLLLLLVLVIAIGLPAGWYGPKIYSEWRQRHWLEKASQCRKDRRLVDSVIYLRRVIILNHDNLEALRALAEIADAYVPTEGVILRERIFRLVPNSYPDAVAWALSALRVGQAAPAEEAFEAMEKLGKPNAAFYEIGARVALALGRLGEARSQFARALELDPANESNQLEIATLDVRLPDPVGRERARATLARLRENPTLRHAALRALVGDRVENGTIAEALALAKDFVNDAEATFQDRVQYLGILRAKEDPGFAFKGSFDEKSQMRFGLVSQSLNPSFASYLNELQADALGDAVKVALLVEFLNSRGLSLLACEWTSTMPREFVSAPPVAPQLAEAYRLTLDWTRLEELIAAGGWGDFEYMRSAYNSLVLKEKGDSAGAAVQWTTAVKLAEYRSERLLALARTVSSWEWSAEFEEILWISARISKRPREALEELVRLYRKKGDAPKLYTAWSRLFELEPEDITVRKNWARLSVLLNNERYRAGTVAQELYRQHPDDPEIVTTYALVLHLRQQDREGLAAMNRLTPEQLRTPAIAGYYGILLYGNKQRDEAAKFLAIAQEAVLLREERELMDQTRRSLDPVPLVR
ncbi:MAG: hypothetical protein WCF18_17000 [Chthoniobacteraceae bacterium]